jgi:hypothetical protein
MEVSRDGDKVLLTIHFISKQVKLSNEPRRIRFGLIATPSKTMLPYLKPRRGSTTITPRTCYRANGANIRCGIRRSRIPRS